jgi:protein-tyrosine-phosphatase
MAEGLLRHKLNELGKSGVEVQSAGTRSMNGLAPTDETIEVMHHEGIDVSDHRSRALTDESIRKADLILVMEDAHKNEIARKVPEAASKTHLLKEFGREEMTQHPEGFDVPDPIGRPIRDYRYCLGVIKKEIERIVRAL